MKVTYSKGYPSLKSLRDASNEYDNRMHLYMKDNYKYSHCINWQDPYTQQKIDGFIEFLNNNGIKTGSYRDWESPTTGRLEILPK